MAQDSTPTETKTPDQLTPEEIALIRHRSWLAAKKFQGHAFGEIDVAELADYGVFYIVSNLHLIPLPINGNRGALIYTIAYRQMVTRFRRVQIGTINFTKLAINGDLFPKKDGGRDDLKGSARFWAAVGKSLDAFNERDRAVITRAVLHSERPKELAKEYGISFGEVRAIVRKFKGTFRAEWLKETNESEGEEG